MRNPNTLRTLTRLVLAAFALPAAAAAQLPATLPELYDSVRSMHDVEALRRIAAGLDRGAGYAELLARGFVSVRLRELTDSDREAERAVSIFEDATGRYPDSAWAHLGLGLARARAPDVEVPFLSEVVVGQSIAEALGRDPLSRAVQSLERALRLARRLEPAAILLGELALRRRDPEVLERAVRALRTAESPRASPELYRQLAEAEAALGRLAAAATSAERMLAAGGDSTLVLHTSATIWLRMPDRQDQGAAAYFAGLARADTTLTSRYFSEMRPIAGEDEIIEWERLEPGLRVEWIRGFWESRAAASGVTVAERLGEHYTRLARAQREYRRSIARGGPETGALLARARDPELPPLDDRGRIYLRHGAPAEIVRTITYGVRPNESWVYRLPGGKPQMYHFVALRGGHDFTLVNDLFAALDDPTDEGVLRLLEDRAPWEPRYSLLASRWRSARRDPNAALDMQDVILAQEQISAELARAGMDALESDSDRPDFEAELPFYYDIYRFAGDAGRTDVTVAVAIPSQRLEPSELRGELIYPVSLSFILVDTLTDGVTRVDTVQHFRSSRRLRENEYIRTHVTLTAEPTPNTIHRLIIRNAASPEVGQLYGGTTPITDFRVPDLTISDIVLAEEEPGGWERAGVALGLVPPREFGEGVSLTLFYEVYNLPAGTPYRTRVQIDPMDPGLLRRLGRLFGVRSAPVDLQFEGVAQPDERGWLAESRRVRGDLGPGRYRVRVTVANLVTQEETTSTREFLVGEDA